MGYTTDFNGALQITPALKPEVTEYINRFSGTRRMKREVGALPFLDTEGNRGKFGTSEYGRDGEFYAHDDGNYGQTQDHTIIDFNRPPSTQPGLWCQWVIREDGSALEWDGGEKFYHYVEWLKYVITNFIAPQGSVCNGEITWQGEESEDMGCIRVENNVVKVGRAKIEYEF